MKMKEIGPRRGTHVPNAPNAVADPGIPRGDQALKGCANLLFCKFCSENCAKSKRKRTEKGRASLAAFLDPPMLWICHCLIYMLNILVHDHATHNSNVFSLSISLLDADCGKNN